MKKDFKKMALLGLAAGLFCLSAQEALTDNKEITMQCPGDRGCSPSPDECKGAVEVLGLEGRKNSDDYDYDVYTAGEGREDDCDRDSRRSRCKSDRSCNTQDSCAPRKRRGAAKAAQE